MVIRLIGLAVLCALLASCQTLSKEECVAADWQVIGEQDGAAGHDPKKRFARHVKACERAGIVADQTLWFQGYQRGLPRYCTPLNGLSVGTSGKSYANVCPVDLEAGFRDGYDLGMAYHRKKREIESTESRIRGLEQTIQDAEERLRLGKGDERQAQREIDDARWTIRDRDREIGRLQSELRRLEDDIADFRMSRAARS